MSEPGRQQLGSSLAFGSSPPAFRARRRPPATVDRQLAQDLTYGWLAFATVDPGQLSWPVVVLAADPGGRETGLVVRRFRPGGSDLLDQQVVAGRHPTRELPDNQTLAAAAEAFDLLLERWQPDLLAAEDMKLPNAHAGRGDRQILGAMGGAMALGALGCRYPQLVRVSPGRSGAGPPEAYPPALWGPREGKAGTGILRHARSAWDVAELAVRACREGKLRVLAPA